MKILGIIVWLLALLALANSIRLNLRDQRGYVIEGDKKQRSIRQTTY